MFRIRAVVALVGILLGLWLPAGSVGAAEAPQNGLPPGWKRITWQGVVISYNPATYRFESATPDDARARVAARLLKTPIPCGPDVADCGAGSMTLQLFPRRGENVRPWVEQTGSRVIAGFGEGYTDTVIGGRQAAQYVIDVGVGGPLTAYAVPSGTDMLVITTQLTDPRLLTLLQFTQPAPERLAVGQVAMTQPAKVWNLWTAPVGGVRVEERPQLLGSSFVTILAMQRQAVQVRTSDGVTGWLHVAASTALTAKSALRDEDVRFIANGATVAARNGLALRVAPRSTAAKVVTVPTAVDRLPAGQRVVVLGRRGDWLRVFVNDLQVNGWGWMRWNYDGARYLTVAQP